MPDLHVLRVFTARDGAHGNPLGVFVEGRSVPDEQRKAVAADLGFSETVFVDDPDAGRVRIYTSAVELPFAGHPTVGTSWLLNELGHTVDVLRPPAGDIATRQEGELRWIRARPDWVEGITFEQRSDPAEIDGLTGPPPGETAWYGWAWEDEAAGRVRSRFFAPGFGNVEDEATGAAAVVLAGRLGRTIQIRQGQGSELFARPLSDGWVEIGGRCVIDAVREYVLRNAKGRREPA